MAGLPTGTVTFLFTDIEGSTTLLQRLGDRRYAEVLEEHRRLLRAAFAERNGKEIDTPRGRLPGGFFASQGRRGGGCVSATGAHWARLAGWRISPGADGVAYR